MYRAGVIACRKMSPMHPTLKTGVKSVGENLVRTRLTDLIGSFRDHSTEENNLISFYRLVAVEEII